MQELFWLTIAFVCFTVIGYPLIMRIRARLYAKPIHKNLCSLPVSVIIAVHNEAGVLRRKIDNLGRLRKDFVSDMEVIVVSDGSTDETNELLRNYAYPWLRIVLLSGQSGKAVALNHGVEIASGEILVFTDVRQIIADAAMSAMLENYADPTVGGVSGCLRLTPLEGGRQEGESLKWDIENSLRSAEGRTGSLVGALGAFYSIRRHQFVQLPTGTILDDMWVPLHVTRAGYRVVLEERAVAWDDVCPTMKQEFRRKLRTATGNYQLMRMAPWVLSTRNPLLLRFVFHKVFRLLMPFALLIALISTALIPSSLYRALFLAQIIFYAAATAGVMGMEGSFLGRWTRVAGSFLVLNGAAFFAPFKFFDNADDVWVRDRQ